MRVQSYLGYHSQDPFPDWNLMLRRAYDAGYPFRSVKVFHPEDYPVAQAASPGIFVVYRPWVDAQHQGHWIEMAANGQAIAAANDYIDCWIDSVYTYMPGGAVESLNEEYPTADPGKLAAVTAFDRAFIQVMAQRLPGRRAVVFTAAVGNPGWNELNYLVGLAQTATAHGAIFGYHGYWPVKDKVSRVTGASAWQNLQGRFVGIDDYLIGRGYRVKWFLGEVGAMGVANLDPPPGGNWGMSVVNGWKHPSVWNGDEAAYQNDLAAFDRQLAASRPAREGRLLGSAIFTSNNDAAGTWRYFRVNDGMAWRVADLVKLGVEVAVEPPPPPPPPSDPRSALWAASIQEQIDHGLSLNAGAAIQRAITADGLTPVHSEITVTVDGTKYTIQAAEDLTGRVARRVYVWQPGRAVWSFVKP